MSSAFAATAIDDLSSLGSLKISPRAPDVSLGRVAYAGILLLLSLVIGALQYSLGRALHI